MTAAANIAVALIAALHLYILVLEMFLWTGPVGRKAFGLDAAFAQATKVLAANQGLYNGFLAAGLLWGLWLGSAGRPIPGTGGRDGGKVRASARVCTRRWRRRVCWSFRVGRKRRRSDSDD